MPERETMKIPPITHPQQEASPKVSGDLARDLWGKGRRWPNTVSEMMTSKSIILASNFSILISNRCLQLKSKMKYFKYTTAPKLALIHLVKSYHWSPNSLSQKHEIIHDLSLISTAIPLASPIGCTF